MPISMKQELSTGDVILNTSEVEGVFQYYEYDCTKKLNERKQDHLYLKFYSKFYNDQKHM